MLQSDWPSGTAGVSSLARAPVDLFEGMRFGLVGGHGLMVMTSPYSPHPVMILGASIVVLLWWALVPVFYWLDMRRELEVRG
jgi:hypothetical protein